MTTLPKLILSIEDNADNRLLVRRLLENRGIRVVDAADGDEGVRLARELNPDLVLLDLNLPGMDGHEIATLLKDGGATQRIPVIALTARVMEGDQQRAVVAGCDGYIPKPIDVDTFVDTVVEYYAGRRDRISPDRELEELRRYSRDLAGRLSDRAGGVSIDSETGLGNHGLGLMRLGEEMARAERFGVPISVLAIQVCNLDEIRRRGGTEEERRVIRECARRFQKNRRKYDVLWRAGADLFGLLLYDADRSIAELIRDRIITAVNGDSCQTGGRAGVRLEIVYAVREANTGTGDAAVRDLWHEAAGRLSNDDGGTHD